MRKSDNLAFPELTSHHSFFLRFCVGIGYWITKFLINLLLDWYIVVVIFDFTYHIFWIHSSISFKKSHSPDACNIFPIKNIRTIWKVTLSMNSYFIDFFVRFYKTRSLTSNQRKLLNAIESDFCNWFNWKYAL